MAMDEAKLNDFLGKAVGDMGAAMSAVLVLIGDKLGLYRAMAGAGPLTAAEVARRALPGGRAPPRGGRNRSPIASGAPARAPARRGQRYCEVPGGWRRSRFRSAPGASTESGLTPTAGSSGLEKL